MNKMMTLRASLGVLVLCFALGACGGGGGGGGGSPNPPNNPPSNPPQNPPQNPPNDPPTLPDPSTAPALKDEFPLFQIGAAIEPEQIDIPADRALLLKHYNTLTAENAMKADTIAPVDPNVAGGYNFERADKIVDFAMENGMDVHGHALVWHTTSPDWFFDGNESDPDYRAIVQQRLVAYITAVVTRYKGRVKSWDVVNEVASDNEGETYRNSKWYQAFSANGGDGREYIRIAFEAARAADPDALLFINDYSTENPTKLAKVLEIVDYVEAMGTVEVDGVGHQFHLQRNANPDHLDVALTTVEERNLRNRVTELDISIYSDPGSCFVSGTGCQSDYGANFDNIPRSVIVEHAQLYRDVFNVFRAHDSTIDAVTTWGVSDAHTWLNFWPVTRVNRPLLFDTEGNPKLAFWAVVDSAFEIE